MRPNDIYWKWWHRLKANTAVRLHLYDIRKEIELTYVYKWDVVLSLLIPLSGNLYLPPTVVYTLLQKINPCSCYHNSVYSIFYRLYDSKRPFYEIREINTFENAIWTISNIKHIINAECFMTPVVWYKSVITHSAKRFLQYDTLSWFQMANMTHLVYIPYYRVYLYKNS